MFSSTQAQFVSITGAPAGKRDLGQMATIMGHLVRNPFGLDSMQQNPFGLDSTISEQPLYTLTLQRTAGIFRCSVFCRERLAHLNAPDPLSNHQRPARATLCTKHVLIRALHGVTTVVVFMSTLRATHLRNAALEVHLLLARGFWHSPVRGCRLSLRGEWLRQCLPTVNTLRRGRSCWLWSRLLWSAFT